MTVANMRWGWMRARLFDGTHSFSTTVQVLNRTVVADIDLFSTWTAGENHTAAIAHIGQIVSDSGVENFATEWGTVNSPPTLFRVNVTSVTFKLEVFSAQAMARWMIYDWV
jgi:hypothetical protein